MKKVLVIGAGFSGLAAACCLQSEGFSVKVIEKNDSPGGRARKFDHEGFTFDMGPSWYWMPDVFENFFKKFDKKVEDFYELIRLDPSYRVHFGKDDFIDVPASQSELYDLFEDHEKGSAEKLKLFLEDASYKYKMGMNEFVWKPAHSILEFMDWKIIKSSLKLQMFSSISKQIRNLFKNPKLISILEFPVLFLGATPQKTPALYSLMNYADLSLGTWYPMGGMHKVIEGMMNLAKGLGVKFEFDQSVRNFEILGNNVKKIRTDNDEFHADIIVSSADYRHVDQELTEKKYRQYSKRYWDRRDMAPSSLVFYLGVDKKLKGLLHHNLFFDKDFEKHAEDIYENPNWPREPLFYVCCPSKTDEMVAPDGCENLFLLMPLAPGLEDNDTLREKYFDIIMDRLESLTDENIRDHIIFKKAYCVNDFKEDYNAFKGNAYGLANTLRQTAFLKPKMKSKKVKNLYFCGQLTTPGPGVPPSLISGQVVASEILKR